MQTKEQSKPSPAKKAWKTRRSLGLTDTVQSVAVKDLTPNPWGTDINPPMTDDDYQRLKADIESHMEVQIPLITWLNKGKTIVVSGNTRLRIAKEVSLKHVPAIRKTFDSETDAKLFAINDNLARRQLSTAQKAKLALKLQRLIDIKQGRPSNGSAKVPDTRDARKEAAKQVGVSTGSISAMKAVEESGNKKLEREVLSGKKSLSAAAKQVQRKKVKKGTKQPSDGTQACADVRAIIKKAEAFVERHSSQGGACSFMKIALGQLKKAEMAVRNEK